MELVFRVITGDHFCRGVETAFSVAASETRYRVRRYGELPVAQRRSRSLSFSRNPFPGRGGRGDREARVNLAQTANDKQRRRAVYAFREKYWGCLAARLREAPRIPEACWIASQTHSLPAPLCYCCQGGGKSTGVISAPWESNDATSERARGRERENVFQPDFSYPFLWKSHEGSAASVSIGKATAGCN